MPDPKDEYVSPKEYFRLEEASDSKSEYFQGEIFAMAGASLAHDRIAVNIVSDLDAALEGSDRVVFSSAVKVGTNGGKHFFYPDASVVCGDVELEKDRNDTIMNPVAVFEVLSKSTMDCDRGTKFVAYRQIPALKEYVLVDQYSCRVEHYFKDESGRWVPEDLNDPHDILKLDSINVRLPLERIYRRLEPARPGG